MCVYSRKENDTSITCLLLYVHDILLASSSDSVLEKLCSQFKNKFKITDLEESERFVGISVNRDRKNGIIPLNQENYDRCVS